MDVLICGPLAEGNQRFEDVTIQFCLTGTCFLTDVLFCCSIQKVHGEEANIHFNANSLWRWCDFSAHPRVMLYADRTGVELSDIRVRR